MSAIAVSYTVSLGVHIPAAIRLASKRQNISQRDIVEAALMEWIKNHAPDTMGYGRTMTEEFRNMGMHTFLEARDKKMEELF